MAQAAMNPGVMEEAGGTARSAIDALKTTPVVLALVIFNVIYMLGSFYQGIKQAEVYDHAAERWKSVYETAIRYCPGQNPAALAPKGDYRLQSEESHPYVPTPLPQERPKEADAPEANHDTQKVPE